MKFSIKTIGCKTNQYESEALREQFIKNGYVEVEDDEAEIYIINTCTVTAEADKKSRKAIHKARSKNPSSYIIATGCYAQSEGERLLKEGADLVVGNDAKHLIFEYIKKGFRGYIKLFPDIREAENIPSLSMDGAQKRTRAFLLIQDGCDRFCTYCKVPYTRGKARSRKEEEIIEQLKKFVRAGHKEIVLVGTNIGSYGNEWGTNLTRLLHRLSKIKGEFRIRLSSIEPDEIDDELIKIMQEKKFCPHLHIPLQSGDDRILRLMGRRYRAEDYILLCKKIKESIEDVSITTDVMVGFPTETDREFENTINVIKCVKFLKVHVFPYSRREGTFASTLEEVPPHVKKERTEVAQEVSKKISFEFRKQFLGKTLDALMESSFALTSNYMRVWVENCKERGFFKVRIDKVDEERNYGSILFHST